MLTTLSTPSVLSRPPSTRSRAALFPLFLSLVDLPLTLLLPSSYMTYLKGYMKAIKAHLAETNPERVPAFEKGAAVFAKKFVSSLPTLPFSQY